MTANSTVSTTFPQKLHEIISDEQNYEIIRWVNNGTAFKVMNSELFEANIVKKYFRQTKLTSFQRQLNLYGFRRMNKGDYHGSYFHCNFQQNRLDLLVKVRRVSAKNPNNNAHTSIIDSETIKSLTQLSNGHFDGPIDEFIDDDLEKALLASPIQGSFDQGPAKKLKVDHTPDATTGSGSSNGVPPNPTSSSSAVNTNINNTADKLPSSQAGLNGVENNSQAPLPQPSEPLASPPPPPQPGRNPNKNSGPTIQSAQNHGHKSMSLPGGTVPLPPHPFLLQQNGQNGTVSQKSRPRIPNNLPGILKDESTAAPALPTISIPPLHRGISHNTEAELAKLLASGQPSAPNSFSSVAMDSTGKPVLHRTQSDMWAQIDIEKDNPVDSIIDGITFGDEGPNSRGGEMVGIASPGIPASRGVTSLSSPSKVPFNTMASPVRLARQTTDESNLHLLSAVAFHRSSSREDENGGDNKLPVVNIKLLNEGDDEDSH